MWRKAPGSCQRDAGSWPHSGGQRGSPRSLALASEVATRRAASVRRCPGGSVLGAHSGTLLCGVCWCSPAPADLSPQPWVRDLPDDLREPVSAAPWRTPVQVQGAGIRPACRPRPRALAFSGGRPLRISLPDPRGRNSLTHGLLGGAGALRVRRSKALPADHPPLTLQRF